MIQRRLDARDEVLAPPGARLRLLRGFAGADADAWLAGLLAGLPWTQDRVEMFGRSLVVPRLSAWFGEPGAEYSYSGIAMRLRPWTPLLAGIRAVVEDAAGHGFNSVLANLYRDGRDSVSWHADDEPELGREPVIASLSLGASRRFRLKHKHRKDLRRIDLDLHHGDLLLMEGATQREWLHAVPKRRAALGPRVNLTFRWVLPLTERRGDRRRDAR
ncbi:MAG: alpha-ketoglutarate-dependent dioxygenase AlkB [Planctomycetota bacterium]